MRPVALAAAVALLATACAGTKLTSTWKDPEYHKQPKKILVVTMVWDPKNRQRFDESLVRLFKARGLDAVAGYDLFPEPRLPEKDVAAPRVRDTGADTVLLVKLLDKTSNLRYLQGTDYYDPGMYRDWPAYYGAGYATGVDPEYAIAEAKLFDVETERLIWGALSQTTIQNDRQATFESYTTALFDELTKERLIP
ncbi:MAG: hypothetical protein ACOYXU_05665 [Nitrospirota bacterium]